MPAEILVKIRGYHLPYILLDRFQKGSDHHTVTIDYRQAMYELTKYMLELGNRDILYLRSLSNYDVALQKSAGYRQAMREFEREPIEREVDGDSAEKAF